MLQIFPRESNFYDFHSCYFKTIISLAFGREPLDIFERATNMTEKRTSAQKTFLKFELQ